LKYPPGSTRHPSEQYDKLIEKKYHDGPGDDDQHPLYQVDAFHVGNVCFVTRVLAKGLLKHCSFCVKVYSLPRGSLRVASGTDKLLTMK
jgi:hypothetical protein